MRLGFPSLLGSGILLVLCHLTLDFPHPEDRCGFFRRLLLPFCVPETFLLLHRRNHEFVDGDLEKTDPCSILLRTLDLGFLEKLFRYLWSPGVAEGGHDVVDRELSSVPSFSVELLSRLRRIRSWITGSENDLEFLDPHALVP